MSYLTLSIVRGSLLVALHVFLYFTLGKINLDSSRLLCSCSLILLLILLLYFLYLFYFASSINTSVCVLTNIQVRILC